MLLYSSSHLQFKFFNSDITHIGCWCWAAYSPHISFMIFSPLLISSYKKNTNNNNKIRSLNKSQTNRLLALPHRPPPKLPSPDWESLLGLQVKLAPSISLFCLSIPFKKKETRICFWFNFYYSPFCVFLLLFFFYNIFIRKMKRHKNVHFLVFLYRFKTHALLSLYPGRTLDFSFCCWTKNFSPPIHNSLWSPFDSRSHNSRFFRLASSVLAFEFFRCRVSRIPPLFLFP